MIRVPIKDITVGKTFNETLLLLITGYKDWLYFIPCTQCKFYNAKGRHEELVQFKYHSIKFMQINLLMPLYGVFLERHTLNE